MKDTHIHVAILVGELERGGEWVLEGLESSSRQHSFLGIHTMCQVKKFITDNLTHCRHP